MVGEELNLCNLNETQAPLLSCELEHSNNASGLDREDMEMPPSEVRGNFAPDVRVSA